MNRKDFGVLVGSAMLAGFLGGIAAVFISGNLAMARDPIQQKKVLVAEEFRLVDKDGQMRGFLGRDAENKVGLFLTDKSDVQASLVLDGLGDPLLTMRQHEAKRRVALGLLEGVPTLLLLTSDGEGGIGATVLKDDKANIYIFDSGSKKLVWRALVEPK